MTRYVFTTAAALLLLTPSPGQAQGVFLFGGGGGTLAVGEYGDCHKAGWMGTAGLGVSLPGGRLAVGGEGYYGRNSADPADQICISEGFTDGDNTNLYGGSGWVAARLGQPGQIAPYVLGSAGALVNQFDPQTGDKSSETKFAWSAGAGLDIPLSSIWSIYVEGRYMRRGSTAFVPIFAGISISLGGGGNGGM